MMHKTSVILILLQFITCWTSTRVDLVDRRSFITKFQYNEHFEDGIHSFNDGRFIDALKYFSSCYELIPNEKSSLYALLSAIKSDNLAQSLLWFDFFRNNAGTVVYSEINIKEMLLDFGVSKYYQRDYEGSIKIYNCILQLDPFHVNTLFNLGVALSRIGNYIRSMETFELATQLDPQDYRSHLNLATLHHERGKIDDAILHYR